MIVIARSLQEILDHADGLADAIEAYEPRDEDRLTPAELELSRAVIDNARSSKAVAEAVDSARGAGASWPRIAALLGVSPQAARERFGHQRAARHP